MLTPVSQPTTVWGLLEAGTAIDPGAPALVTGGAPVDYKTFHATAAALATALCEYGIAPGDRIAFLDRNTPAFLTWTFACAGVGAVLVPVNLRLAAHEIQLVLDDSEPLLVIAHESFKSLVEEALASAEYAPEIVCMGTGANALPLGLRPKAVRPGSFLPAPCTPDDVCHLYYTSGTTGRPKGVPLTHRNVVTHALAATSELDLASDDVWGHIAPMFHLADAWATLAITAVGGAHAFLPEFDARGALGIIEELEVTVTNLVPTMLQRMIVEAPNVGFDGGALRLVLSGGAPISPSAVRNILDVFRCEYVQTYGLTETSPYLTLAALEPKHRKLDEDKQLARRARTGRPFETVELDVVDENGKPVPHDDRAVGEIVARGTTITPGYWNRPDETALAFRDGWFHTGDLATIDRDGWVDIVDRKKDMIVTGGENVYSIEVENALYEHPAVLECAAFGLPSEEWGETVCAAVVLRAGSAVDADALREHCATLIARYKIPRRIDLVDDLPKTGSGKIAKRLLRERAVEHP